MSVSVFLFSCLYAIVILPHSTHGESENCCEIGKKWCPGKQQKIAAFLSIVGFWKCHETLWLCIEKQRYTRKRARSFSHTHVQKDFYSLKLVLKERKLCSVMAFRYWAHLAIKIDSPWKQNGIKAHKSSPSRYRSHHNDKRWNFNIVEPTNAQNTQSWIWLDDQKKALDASGFTK